MDGDFAQATVGPRGHVSYGTDEDLAVTFYMRPIKDERESATQGRPIFRDVPYVKIQMPGDKLSAFEAKVTQEHRLRFPRQWAMFEAGHTEQQIVGTPLREWPPLTAAQVAEMNALSIFTVEQLAGLSDTGLDRLGLHARTLQNKARAFLESAKSAAPIEHLTAENAQLRERLDALEATNRQALDALAEANRLMAQMKEQQTAAGAGGGGGGGGGAAFAVPPVASAVTVAPAAGGGPGQAPAKRGPGRPRKGG